ncbi:DUF4232 domain-containing protein [Streptomyces tubbatahanensis]|uniref:DUF4232 domain-containing protein n=1 Tax=Streptomyces tubbatahanensis TaxID=2923272 RepID=A0ABY3XUI0_9ACTN|nr:DUF4232 domain-containing protein [Streptomyces tubbatahanensis]UNS98104.1 DUF4232 domain-containing protein [Streptomyces tubbatahanensis]
MAAEQDIVTGQDERAVAGGGGAPRRTRRGLARPARIATAAAALVAAGGLLTACGGQGGDAAGAHKAGAAAPAGAVQSEGSTGSTGSGDSGGTGGSGGSGSSSGGSGAGVVSTESGESGQGGAHQVSSAAGQCTSSDLSAKVGPNHPGAGQENFALVLTNTSGSNCTVYGFPGFAFVDSDGDQVSLDPERNGDSGETIKLTPGGSAWAPLSFTNPEMTGVPTVTPDAALITPPDQRSSLKVDWTGGPVSATGKASVPTIGALTPGSGA